MSGKQKKRFDKIAKDCVEANVPFPEQLVDRFERVAKKLNEDWGRPPAAEYLHDLIFPSRPGRQGFPPEVAEEILALKNLHEERYTNMFQTVWDPFDQMYRDKSGEEEKKEAESEYTPPPDSKPSIYKTRKQVAETTAEEQKYSAMVGQLLPESLRKTLARIRMAGAQSGLRVTLPPPESELEELLLDAESLLEEEHFNSGTAILEQITTLFPDESPFAYLRLMEVYQLIERPEDFDWVSQRLCEQFNCARLEWTIQRRQFRADLDKLAESFLIGMRRE
ncbi:MAG: hypothetical protein JSU95_12995 [Betaproteobacteria bacterium]|nr:MAG: hypothetical protein JSU95_12995 [Betaproteobacteria bacterium]